MNRQIRVSLNDALPATVDASDVAWPPTDDTPVQLQLQGGRKIQLRPTGFTPHADGSWAMAVDPTELDAALRAAGADMSQDQLVVPVIVEQLEVGKHRIETGRVRISKTIREEQHVVDPPLMRERVTVDRVPINKFVNGGDTSVRFEGDTMIVPVLEEVIVVEKRLMLKEELHIRKEAVEHHDPKHVTVRTEEAHVERVPGQSRGAQH